MSTKIDLAVVGSAPDAIAQWALRVGFAPQLVNGATLWSRAGWIGTWDQMPTVYADQSAKERLVLEKENEKLRAVSAPRSWMTGEYWLHVLAAGGMAVLAYQGEILELAKTLGPQWSKAANVLVMGVVWWAANVYKTKRVTEKAQETVAKEQVIGQDRRQP